MYYGCPHYYGIAFIYKKTQFLTTEGQIEFKTNIRDEGGLSSYKTRCIYVHDLLCLMPVQSKKHAISVSLADIVDRLNLLAFIDFIFRDLL